MPKFIRPKLDFLDLLSCDEPLQFIHAAQSHRLGPPLGNVTILPPLRFLTVLRLTGCRVSGVFIKTLLAQVGPHLDTFVLVSGYVEGHEATQGVRPDEVTPKQLADSLLPWTETLRVIRIDLSKVCHRSSRIGREDLISSFRDFARLEVLELDMLCVYIPELQGLITFGVDTAQADSDLLLRLLPDSIREFVLNGPTHRFYDALELLSDCRAEGVFPDLVQVRCDDGPRAHLEHLQERFEYAGVGFSLRVPKSGFRGGMYQVHPVYYDWN